MYIIHDPGSCSRPLLICVTQERRKLLTAGQRAEQENKKLSSQVVTQREHATELRAKLREFENMLSSLQLQHKPPQHPESAASLSQRALEAELDAAEARVMDADFQGVARAKHTRKLSMLATQLRAQATAAAHAEFEYTFAAALVVGPSQASTGRELAATDAFNVARSESGGFTSAALVPAMAAVVPADDAGTVRKEESAPRFVLFGEQEYEGEEREDLAEMAQAGDVYGDEGYELIWAEAMIYRSAKWMSVLLTPPVQGLASLKRWFANDVD